MFKRMFLRMPVTAAQSGYRCLGLFVRKSPILDRNAVHLSGAALRFTGNLVFEIFTVLGLDGLGR
ncbi:hypothetical protein SAMN05216475_0624 [Pseudomonas synxantha]|uniref:Uncharacterized protein n=1 Tax=Pseudomonas synxantha TaxID=47883 RepID=A0AAX3I3N6_9PSED|nr:hypothetical protein SAMN05216475_0624 [Pseudomonas synxantha]VTQ93219.1 Uncharacterised protein [Pseudomonas synxantha]